MIKFQNQNENIGKKIFEAKYLGEYNPENKQYVRKQYNGWCLYESYTSQKYHFNNSDNPSFYKIAEQKYLYENLKCSTEPKEMIERLLQFEELGLIYAVDEERSIEEFKTKIISFFMPSEYYHNNENKLIVDKKNLLRKVISSNGYFIAYENKGVVNGYDVVWFSIHPLYIIEVTDEVYEESYFVSDNGLEKEIPGNNGILYHLTMKKNMNHIDKYGLIPRNSHTYVDNYPDRVYFWWSNSRPMLYAQVAEHAKKFKKEMITKLKETYEDYKNGKISYTKLKYIYDHRYDYREWVILKIDLKSRAVYDKNDITTQYRFFDDPKSQGLFTYENIDPLCITVDDEYYYRENSNDLDNIIEMD